MANHNSAAKAARQSERRRVRNKSVKSVVKSTIRRAEVLVVGDDPVAAEAAVTVAVSTLGKAAKRGILHKRNAARRRSRLTLKLNKAKAAS